MAEEKVKKTKAEKEDKPEKKVKRKTKKVAYQGTGRRKDAVARVQLIPGKGKFDINGQDLEAYFGREMICVDIRRPLEITDTLGKFDVIASIYGGGVTGQAGALRHGISRALLEADESFKELLKKAGLLTRDPRMKERRKYGLKKARKAPQFSKR